MQVEAPRYFTLATWQVAKGDEEAFLAAWEELGEAFGSLPGTPATERFLLRSLQDPSRFYSFGPRKDLESIQAMRADPTAQAALGKVRSLCVSASQGRMDSCAN